MRQSSFGVFTAVVVETPAALSDEAAGVFAAYGALGSEIKSVPSGQRRNAPKLSRLYAYFGDISQSSMHEIVRVLHRAGMLADRGAAPQICQVRDPGWSTMWQKRFEPLPIGDRLIVIPPWKQAPRDGRIPVVIRPGQAFGTGHHASTFGALNIVEQLFAKAPRPRVLDVGTGSGILAIAMRKLGAAHVTAIDLDSIALENAQENARLNGVARAIRFSVAPLTSIRGRFDLITGNILSSVLIELAPRLKARLRSGGCLVLGGILAREAAQVAAAYRPELRRLKTRADGLWRTLLLQL